MARTTFCRSRVGCEILGDCRAAACDRKFSCDGAYGFLLNRGWHCELLRLQVFVYPAHDAFPQAEPEVRIIVAFFVIIVAAPYRACIVRGEAAEPQVLIGSGGTSLAGNRHVRKLACRTCTRFHNRLHRAGQKSSRAVLENGTLFACSFQKHIAVVIQNLRIQGRRIVYAAIGDRGIGSAHLVIVNAVCDASQRQSLAKVAVYASVDFLAFYKGGDAEFLAILKA